MRRVLVVGCGLIGTSLGLALASTHDVLLHDVDPAHLATAVARGAGRPWDGRRWDTPTTADVAVLCVPLPALAPQLLALQRLDLGCTFSHVASVQSQVLLDVESAGCTTSTVCGGHPMAGKASAGPGEAEAGLFRGRPWFVCPGPDTSEAARAAVRDLAVAAGAQPVETTPPEHDRTVAVVSHLPQVLSSALAARLLADPAAPAYAGPGLVDTTRLAGSPVDLWRQVLSANAAEVAPLLREVARDLTAAADELDGAPTADDLVVVTDLLRRGAAGRALVPVKRGRTDSDLEVVRAVLPDEPGHLVALLTLAAAAGVNVEDLRLDHEPGRASGTVELLVTAASRPVLVAALLAARETVLDA